MDDFSSHHAGEEAALVTSMDLLELEAMCDGKKLSNYSSAVPHTNATTEAQELLVRLCEKFDVRTPEKRDMNILLDKMKKESRVHSNQVMVFAIFTLKGNMYCSPDIIIKKVAAVGDAEDKKLESKIENAMKSILKYLSRVEVDLAKDRFPDVFGGHTTPTEELTKEEESLLYSTELTEKDLSEEEFLSWKVGEDVQKFYEQFIIPEMTKKEEEKENDLLEREEDDWMTDEDEFLA